MMNYMDENNIFWFEVPVDDVMLMKIFDGLKERPDNKGDGFLLESFPDVEDIEELSIGSQLHEEIKALFIAKYGVHFQDAFMIGE
jgi:hypothetical protein